jgi:DNA-binding protein HU-beta
MSDTSIDKNDLIKLVAKRTGYESRVAEAIIDATFEEIYHALKHGKSVSLRGFGTFYIDCRRTGTVFKFNPSQRLRALFGWKSTYKGEL